MSITDKVAIVAASCTPFGEHWDRGTDDLLRQAVTELECDAKPDAYMDQRAAKQVSASGFPKEMLGSAAK